MNMNIQELCDKYPNDADLGREVRTINNSLTHEKEDAPTHVHVLLIVFAAIMLALAYFASSDDFPSNLKQKNSDIPTQFHL